jgi:uncharacterized protein YdbL (DUF1318 family)
MRNLISGGCMNRFIIPCVMLAFPAGCIETKHHVIVEQPKPMEINVNITGQLDLVIQDARENVEKINGEKPTNVVRPEDIGLPPATGKSTTGGGAAIDSGFLPPHIMARRGSALERRFVPVVLRSVPVAASPVLYPVVQGGDPTQSMAARNPQIRALWESKAVGEAHSGLLVARGTLTADQQKLVDAENKDRTALYTAEAKTKSAGGQKVTGEDVALAYYLARLGYAKAGNWYEKNNAGKWEWKQWGQ